MPRVALQHEDVVAQIEKSFGGMSGAAEVKTREKPQPLPATNVWKRDLEQVHFCLGMKGLQHNHSLRFNSYVLNTILGGGMSSRLFQEIRENRGLAYSVYSYLPTYIDAGLMVVYAGTSGSTFQEVIDLILKELNHLKNDPFKNGELMTAKEQLKGNLLLSLESSDNLMTRLAKNEIYFDSYLPIETILKGIDHVDEEGVKSMAAQLFDEDSFCLTVLGPMNGESVSFGKPKA